MKIWVEVTAVAKAFKWRKSYGVENLDDSALNRFVLVPGEGFGSWLEGWRFISVGTAKDWCRIIFFWVELEVAAVAKAFKWRKSYGV